MVRGANSKFNALQSVEFLPEVTHETGISTRDNPFRNTMETNNVQTNAMATVSLEKLPRRFMKWPYLESRPTTTMMTNLPFDGGSLMMKSIEIP